MKTKKIKYKLKLWLCGGGGGVKAWERREGQ